MCRFRSQSVGDVDMVDVILGEDEAADEFLAVLHQVALEAMALRANSPGDPRTEVGAGQAQGPAAADGRATTWLIRRLGKRRVVRLAVIAAAALAVAIAPGVVDARRAAARLAALEATPGVLEPATSPPVELWRTPGRVVSDRADLLLVAGAQGGSLRRVDPATGEATWTVSSAADDAPATGHCLTVDEALRPDRAPVEERAGPGGLVACVVAADEGREPGADGPARVRVVVIDTGRGVVTQTVAVEGALLVAEALSGDLLVAEALADGRLSAARWDLETRTPRWEYVSPHPVLTDVTGFAVELRPDSLSVGDLALDLAIGEELDAEEVRREPIRHEEYTLPGGARVTWSWDPDGDSGQGSVTRKDGGWAFGLWGPPLVPAITDDSEAGTLVVMTGDGDWLLGRDLRTGRSRWSRPYGGALPVRAAALVDGVMLLDDGAAVTAIDVRTGGGLWSAPVASGVTQGSALIDGEVVLLPVRDDGTAVQLVARRIADGAQLWRTGTPAGTVSLTVVDHHLVASTGDTVVGLGDRT